ncbi:MAG: DUF3267 domain-containing protein [Bacillota bacterium]
MLKVKETIDIRRAMVLTIVMLLVAVIVACAIKFTCFDSGLSLGIWDIFVACIAYCILIFLHEIVHAMFFIIFGSRLKDLKFGIAKNMTAVYCHSSKEVKVWQYIVILVMPTLVLGIVPMIFAVMYWGYAYVILFALVFSGGAGDFMMIAKAIKYPKYAKIYDDPNEPAFTVELQN